MFLLQTYTKPGENPRRIGDRLVWVVRSSDLTHWVTRAPNTIRWQYSEDKYFRSLPAIFIFSSQKYASPRLTKGWWMLSSFHPTDLHFCCCCYCLDIYCLFSFCLENNKPQISFRYKVVKVSLKGVLIRFIEFIYWWEYYIFFCHADYSRSLSFISFSGCVALSSNPRKTVGKTARRFTY